MSARSIVSIGLVAALTTGFAVAPASTTPPSAGGPDRVAADVADSLPSTSGELPGPDVLYDEAPDVPQLQNTGVWRADPLLVSGATAYRDGEWLYQDWLLDDHGARGVPDPESPYNISSHLYSPAAGTYTYPTGDGFAHNDADLVELRTRVVGDQLAFRVTYNTLTDPERTAFTIALDATGDAPVRAWPNGAGVSSPATHWLTVAGDEATLQTFVESTPTAMTVAESTSSAQVDLVRNQVEVSIPLADLGEDLDQLGLTIGTGLWNPASDAYLAPQPGPATATTPGGGTPHGVAITNVGPRTNGQEPYPLIAGATMADTAAGAAVLAAWWREQAQSQALTTGDISPFHQVIDLDKLRDRTTDESGVPTTGAINRILPSRHAFGEGIDLDRVCFGISSGIDLGADCEGRFVGALQSYTVHVPDREVPDDGWGLTLLLHSLSANHNQYTDTQNAWQLAERGDGHLVVTPGGRGPDGFYKGFAETDTFEVWNDVARHYDLDPDVAAVTGYSMGGFGTYRLLARWPDLFESGFSVVGRPGTAMDQLASLRNHRLLVWNAAGDELVQVNAAEEAHHALVEAGIVHDYWLFPGADHLTLAANDEYGPGADFLGAAEVDRDPQRISYVVDASEDNAAAGMVADAAYWLSAISLADAEALGTVEAAVAGARRHTAEATPGAGALTGGFMPAMPYVTRGAVVTAEAAVLAPTLLELQLGNVRHLVVDVGRAGVGCDAELDVETDTSVTIELAGCNRTVVADAG